MSLTLAVTFLKTYGGFGKTVLEFLGKPPGHRRLLFLPRQGMAVEANLRAIHAYLPLKMDDELDNKPYATEK